LIQNGQFPAYPQLSLLPLLMGLPLVAPQPVGLVGHSLCLPTVAGRT